MREVAAQLAWPLVVIVSISVLAYSWLRVSMALDEVRLALAAANVRMDELQARVDGVTGTHGESCWAHLYKLSAIVADLASDVTVAGRRQDPRA